MGGGVGEVIPDRLDWPSLSIILDSPLATRFTRFYRELDEFWDAEARSRLKKGRNPLAFRSLLTVDSHQAHLGHGQPPGANRPVGHCYRRQRHVFQWVYRQLPQGHMGDERHGVLFVGYQAEGTVGRQIQCFGLRAGYVEMDGKHYGIRAQTHGMRGYSAHVEEGLIRFVTRMRYWPSEVRIVHGERTIKECFTRAVQAMAKKGSVGVAIAR